MAEEDEPPEKRAWADMQANPPKGCATYIAYLAANPSTPQP